MESNTSLYVTDTPTVSVIICAYNAQDTVAEAIKSVLDQTYSRFEVIFVNDGSKDDTLSQARSFAANDPRIKIIDQPNNGLGASRNIAIDAGVGEYIAFLDADDTWCKEKLALQLQVFENHKDADIVITNCLHYGASDFPTTFEHCEPEYIQDYFEQVAGHNLFFLPTTALLKREIFRHARFTHDHSGQDYYPFLVWSVMNCRLYRLNCPLYAQRSIPDSLQRSPKARFTSGLARYNSIHEVLVKSDYSRYLDPQRIEILVAANDRFLRWASHGARQYLKNRQLISFILSTRAKYHKKIYFIIELIKSILFLVYRYRRTSR